VEGNDRRSESEETATEICAIINQVNGHLEKLKTGQRQTTGAFNRFGIR
jgi:hypothetical protein